MKLSDKKVTQLTNNGAANFAPYFHPAGDKIIYASNVADPQGRNFDLYLIEIATKTIERITFNETFDAFPMFSHDGKKLVFASNRNGVERGETNIFIADWID
jgi:Tol biopolymer transport system component